MAGVNQLVLRAGVGPASTIPLYVHRGLSIAPPIVLPKIYVIGPSRADVLVTVRSIPEVYVVSGQGQIYVVAPEEE